MTTARALIESAARKIQVLGVGTVLSAEEAQDWLSALNSMLASWSAEGNMVFTTTIETFPMNAGQNSYSIGIGQNFNTALPKLITAAYTTENGYDTPLTQIGLSDYAGVKDKTEQNSRRDFYYDSNYPIGRLYLFPVPAQASSITLYTQKPLTGFSSLDTQFVMPGEYERAIIYNLAIEGAPEYEREPSPTVIRIARESKSIVEAQNSQNDVKLLRVDDALLGRGTFDIKAGAYK